MLKILGYPSCCSTVFCSLPVPATSISALKPPHLQTVVTRNPQMQSSAQSPLAGSIASEKSDRNAKPWGESKPHSRWLSKCERVNVQIWRWKHICQIRAHAAFAVSSQRGATCPIAITEMCQLMGRPKYVCLNNEKKVVRCQSNYFFVFNLSLQLCYDMTLIPLSPDKTSTFFFWQSSQKVNMESKLMVLTGTLDIGSPEPRRWKGVE